MKWPYLPRVLVLGLGGMSAKYERQELRAVGRNALGFKRKEDQR